MTDDIKVFDENSSNGRLYIDKENLLLENQTLKEQNASLQYELDKAIHQLKDYEKTLKEYAESDNWELKTLQIEKVKYGWKPALETLKKWENK